MQSFSETELKGDNAENPPEIQGSTEEPKDLENPPQPRDSVSTTNQSKVVAGSVDIVQKVLKTECGHLFHENCLNEWLKIKAECPSCRKPVIDFI